MITKVDDKIFVGQDIIHIQVILKNDERTIYNIVYQDGKDGRFIQRDVLLPDLHVTKSTVSLKKHQVQRLFISALTLMVKPKL